MVAQPLSLICPTDATTQGEIFGLTARESAADCRRLRDSLWERLEILKDLPWYAEWEQGTEPSTAVLAVGRLFDQHRKGLAYLEEYDRERAHVKALHDLMIAKDCPPVDLDSVLAPVDVKIEALRS